MSHDHGHAHPHPRHAVAGSPTWSLLRVSAGVRLAGAAAVAVVIWALVALVIA